MFYFVANLFQVSEVTTTFLEILKGFHTQKTQLASVHTSVFLRLGFCKYQT